MSSVSCSYGSGYSVLLHLLSSLLPPPHPSASDLCDLLRTSGRGGLSYEGPSGATRSLSVADAHWLGRELGFEVKVRTAGGEEREGGAVVDCETKVWKLGGEYRKVAPTTAGGGGGGGGLSGADFGTVRLWLEKRRPSGLSEGQRAEFESAARGLCDVRDAARVSEREVKGAGLDERAFVYGDMTLDGAEALLGEIEGGKDMEWLDLGSGSGLFLYALALCGVKKRLRGVELLAGLVEMSARLPAKIYVIEGDFLDESVPWWEGSEGEPFVVFCHSTVVFEQHELTTLARLFERSPKGSRFVAVGNPLPRLRVLSEVLCETSWGVDVCFIQTH